MTSRRWLDEPPERLAAIEPVEPEPALRRRVLGAVEAGSERFEGFVRRFAQIFDLPEARSREILRAGLAVDGDGWVDAPVPGVRFLHFEGGERVASADTGLVHVAPGTVYPAHRHLGEEWCFVLSGSAEEEGGEIWLPGDLVIREADSVHSYRALGDEPYLFAVVLHGGLPVFES